MIRYGKLLQEDIDWYPQIAYHDKRWNKCRDCGCNGDLRYGLCYACAISKPLCDDKECKSDVFVYLVHGNGD